ncbi:MAG: sulfatase-like hydrolase/transferase [Anaerolineae bacterium]|nr:sulfatase-like hydrolase/transferase [Chloroflexota bacterium]
MSRDKRPNILIFQVDQEQGQVTMPGHPCRTPNADRLAAEGVRFTRAYTIAAHCCPSRASFMSGLNPSGHGIYNNVLNRAAIHTSLNAGVTLWSEVLAESGYNLAYSGKWHVCADRGPADVGWKDYGATSVGGRDHHGTTWEDWRLRTAQPQEEGPRQRGTLLRPGWGTLRLYGTGGTTPEAEPFTEGDYRIVQNGLQALRDLTAQDSPWCLYIGPNGPHDPYIIPEHYARMYDPANVPLPPNWHDDLQDKPRVYQRQRHLWNQLGEDEYREAIAHYWGYCTMQDDLLGLVLDALDQTGQADNTLVLFTSDHGDYAGAHGLFAKGVAAFDECYRVPWIMRWPAGVRNPGREVSSLITHLDIAETLTELAGTRMPAATSGSSLLPWLRDDPSATAAEAVFNQFNGVELYYSQRMVRTQRWVFVHNGFDVDELYDLATDPWCLTNRAEDPACRAVVKDLSRLMWRQACEQDDIVGNPYMTVALAPFGPMVAFE